MATIDEQRAARKALRAAQKNTSADGIDATVGWTTQQGASPVTAAPTSGVSLARPLAFVGGDKPDLSAAPAEPEMTTDEATEVLLENSIDTGETFDREELEDHTVAELKDIAEARDVDLDGATRKDDIIDAILDAQDDDTEE